MPVLNCRTSLGAAVFALIALVLLGLGTTVTRADSPVPPEQSQSAERDEFILGNVLFVLLHEFGHAVIRDFEVPLLGLEENSADTLAAVTLNAAGVRDVMVVGRWVVRNRRHELVDEADLAVRCCEAAPQLWSRMEAF